MSTPQYDLARAKWKGERGSVCVMDAAGAFIADIPIRFMEQGRCSTWEYVLFVVKACVDEQDGDLCTPDDQVITTTSASCNAPPIQNGVYTYKRRDQPDLGCAPSRGPESKTRGKAPKGAASAAASSHTTVSNSKRSSSGQSKFRIRLAARDGWCILTGDPFDDCTAAHIVPYSRPDIYAKVLETPEFLVDLYDESAGFLVMDKYHHSFDRYDWSFFPEGDRLIVHVFRPRTAQDAALHGKVIEPAFFRVSFPSQRPDKRLLMWHYRQCIQMRFRGFAARMTAADAIAEISGAAA